jgi:hypothetical protein
VPKSKLAVVFRLRIGPDRPHRFDLLAHLPHAGREDGVVVLDLLLVPPAAADAKQETPARDLIERGDAPRSVIAPVKERTVRLELSQGAERQKTAPARIAGLALLEAGTARRLAITHLVITLRPGRHVARSS